LTTSDEKVDREKFTGIKKDPGLTAEEKQRLLTTEKLEGDGFLEEEAFGRLNYGSADPLAKKLVVILADRFWEGQVYQIANAERDEGVKIWRRGSRKEKEARRSKVWFEEAGPRAIRWLRGVSQSDYLIRRHDLSFWLDDPKSKRQKIEMTRIIIGNIEPGDLEAWETERRVMETLLFMQTSLGMEVPKELVFYTLATFEEANVYGSLGPAIGNLCGGLSGRIDRRATKSKAAALLIEYGRRLSESPDSRQTYISISRQESGQTAAHEMAHLGDNNFTRATQPQGEGWAVAIEHGLSFREIKEVLRSDFDYRRKITRQGMERLLGKKVKEGAPQAEAYYLTGSFFAYIFEQLGAEGLRKFYDAVATENKGVMTALAGKEEIMAGYLRAINRA
jgi:hypothetical protein